MASDEAASKPVTVRLPIELHEWVVAESLRTHLSVADVIRTSLWTTKAADHD